MKKTFASQLSNPCEAFKKKIGVRKMSCENCEAKKLPAEQANEMCDECLSMLGVPMDDFPVLPAEGGELV